MTEALIILGVIVLSCALRTVGWKFLRKLGIFGFFSASFLVGYFMTDKIWVGFFVVGLWFIFPWFELLTRTRKMRLPVEKPLVRQAPPASRKFPELESLTSEVEGEHFEYVSDTGWNWEQTQQFIRFFYNDDKRTQAAICFTEQESISWACINLTSRHKDGRIFRSINIPFSNPMKSAPNVMIRRDMESISFNDYLEAHVNWLKELGYSQDDFDAQTPDDLLIDVEKEAGQQIAHNVESGIISICDQKKTWRYSWRGLFYLYFQVLKDFVKWC